MNIKLFSYGSQILSIGIFFLMGCHADQSVGPKANKYLLIINAEKGSRATDRMLWFDTLDSSVVLNTDKGPLISNTLGSYVVLKDSFLLSLDKETQLLSKYRYTESGLVFAGQVRIEGCKFIAYTVQLDSNQLYIGGFGDKNRSMYAVIDSKNMRILRRGVLRLPVAKGQNENDNFGVLKNNRLYIGYSSFGEDFDHCSDTSYLAIVDYPALTTRSVAKDTRSAFPGAGVNGVFSTLTDNKGDLYILTSPVFYHGNHPTAPTAFYRVQKDEEIFDKDYFFNLSAQVKGLHLLGITQAGTGKVILSTAPFPATGQSDYYLADVQSKTLKLLLKNALQPNFVWGTSGFYDGENAFFIVNEAQGRARIYIYSSTGQLRKGPAIVGSVSEKSSYLMSKPSAGK